MGDKQGDMHRWLVSQLRTRGFDESDCYNEEGVAVLVRPGDRVVVFYAYWFERTWYLGACARQGATYVLPDGSDVVAACVEWAADWKRTPPAEVSWGAEAPADVVARLGLRQLSRAEIKVWFDAMAQAVKRRLRKLDEP